MSRYIDADALREKWLCLQGHDFSPSSFVYSIDNEPTVDAVQVVRCKDCVKRPPATARNGEEPTSDCPLWCGYCFGIDDNYGGEFFCGKGERKADGKLNG